MNEMEQLTRFREHVPMPGDETVARALAELRIAGADTPAKQPAHQRERRDRRRWAVPVGAVAAALALVVALPAILPLGGPGAPDPAAANVLRDLAQIARRAPAEPAPGPGQYVYMEVMDTQTNLFVSSDGQYRFVYAEPSTQQRWLGVDGSGRFVTTVGQPTFATPQDEATYQAYIDSPGAQTDKQTFDWGTSSMERYAPGDLSYRDTSSLPTDVEQLRQLIEDRQIVGGPPGDWETFVLATDLIRDSYARPDLRAALYEVMAKTPGIELVGPTTDAAGRDGIALASTHDGVRNEVVFDRKTAKILEERTVILSNDEADRLSQSGEPGTFPYATAGKPFFVATYLTFGEVVNSDTQMPS